MISFTDFVLLLILIILVTILGRVHAILCLFRSVKNFQNLSQPARTTTDSEETTTLLGEATTLPEETATEPVETTTEPEEITTEPEETTTVPEETTLIEGIPLIPEFATASQQAATQARSTTRLGWQSRLYELDLKRANFKTSLRKYMGLFFSFNGSVENCSAHNLTISDCKHPFIIVGCRYDMFQRRFILEICMVRLLSARLLICRS